MDDNGDFRREREREIPPKKQCSRPHDEAGCNELSFEDDRRAPASGLLLGVCGGLGVAGRLGGISTWGRAAALHVPLLDDLLGVLVVLGEIEQLVEQMSLDFR